ncbi:MAG: AraC family transcriptional regulator [Burkholderiales bacterium]
MSFRTDALDEVRAFVARADGEHSRVVHGTGPLAYEWHALSGQAVALRWGRAALPQTIRGAVDVAVLHLSIDSVSTYAFGRRRLRVAPGEAIFIAPGWEFTRHGEPGAVVAVGIDRDALAAEMDGRIPPARGARTLLSQAIALRGNARALIERAVGGVVATSRSRSSPRRHDLGEAEVVSLTAELLLRSAEVRNATPVAAARIARVEAWIDAHLHEPITIGRLCAVAGVGARSLQAAFAAAHGVSPMRFVAERRLAAARRCLVRTGHARDVTGVALEVGFSHLGRFATLYRQAFGESPSQTLRSRPA